MVGYPDYPLLYTGSPDVVRMIKVIQNLTLHILLNWIENLLENLQLPSYFFSPISKYTTSLDSNLELVRSILQSSRSRMVKFFTADA